MKLSRSTAIVSLSVLASLVAGPAAASTLPAAPEPSSVTSELSPFPEPEPGYVFKQIFADVPQSTKFAGEISWLAMMGVSTGWAEDNTFRPLQPVNRDAMAAFIHRLQGSPVVQIPAKGAFSDVVRGDQFFTEISWFQQEGHTAGFADGTYRPLDSVNRDAMAAFLYRLADEPEFTAPAVSPFKDITPSTKFYKEITWLASTGITTGYEDGTYRPVSPVKRDAMAAFLQRFHAQFG